MQSTLASRPTRDFLGEIIAAVETIAGKHVTGSAASSELAIARWFVAAMLASADFGESFVTEALSQGIETDVDRLRSACRQYDLRLWQSAPEFLK